MVNQKLHFFIPLGNVDESILKIKLNEGFEFDSMTYDKGHIFLSNLEKFPIENFYQWRHANTVFQHGGMYFIKKSFDFDIPLKENGDPDFCPELYKFAYNLVEKNIENPLHLFRLFKEGNVYIPCWYVYHFKDEIPFIIYARGTPFPQIQSLYHLDDDEIKKAQDFIETTKIPFAFDYIKLAHNNYELSYNVNDDSLSFLSLMISLEVLFKPKQNWGFSKRISRNIGTLLGTSQDEIKKIQKDISDLYKKRSNLVHEGKVIWCYVGEDDDVIILRRFVRDSLKKIILLNRSKDDLLDLLNSKDFGRPSRDPQKQGPG
jgi:hypothetical protein